MFKEQEFCFCYFTNKFSGEKVHKSLAIFAKNLFFTYKK